MCGSNTTLTASGGATYLWNTGSTTSTIAVSPASTAPYTVTVASAAGCTSTATRTVTVNPLPTLSIAGTNTICAGQSTTLTASGGGTYLWNTGATTSTLAVSPGITTPYTATVTNAAGCAATATNTVTVNSLPLVAASASSSVICNGQSTTLTGSGASTYTWTGGVTNGVSFSPTATTAYTVTGTATSGCTNTAANTVTVNPLPTAGIAGTNTICAGQSTTLTASGGATYLWNTGSTTSTIAVSPASTAPYTVTVTSAAGCSATATSTVTVNPLPTLSIAGTTTLCSVSTTTLTASGANTYTWSANAGGVTTASVGLSPTVNTTYTVTGTGAAGCNNTTTSTVITNNCPFITRWNLATAGSGATQLSFGTATGGVVNYTWQEISPGSSSGSGSWSGTTLTIPGLPAGAVIRLQIMPTNFQRININNGTDCSRLTQLEQWGSTVWTSMQAAFYGCANLQVTATDQPVLTGVSDMSFMFYSCSALNSPANINSWNTASVMYMNSMFFGATAFNQNIGSWNTAAVMDMSLMFLGASAFNQNIGSWNTAAVNAILAMFQGASAFNQNIGSWNTAAVFDMSYMFQSASAFNQNIGSWNTSAVTNMTQMFFNAGAFNQNIGAWNTASVTSMANMFRSATAFNQNIGSWNTTAVTNMSYMFYDASAFNQNIGSWNTAAVINMTSMFGATIFNKNIGSWNTAAVTNMGGMFSGANAFNQNIGSWNTAAVTNMSGMLYGTTAFNQNLGSWTLKAGVSMTNMLDYSGMDCSNYSSTLIGWNTNTITPNSLNLGAAGRNYGPQASAARANLVSVKSWTITDAGLSSTTPSFTAVSPICAGAALAPLPTTSTNGITGTWSPALNNTITTTYTFTPGATQCAVTTTLNITVNPLPSVSASASSSVICNGQSTILTGSGASTYTWTGGVTDGVAFSPPLTATYSVTGTSAAGCAATNTATNTVTVNPLPAASIVGTSTICAGQSTTLTASGGATYFWNTGATTSTLAVSPGITTPYTATVTSAAGCTATATSTVTVNSLPTVTASASSSVICNGQSTTLTGSGASTYTWTSGVTNGVAFSPSVTASYTVTGTSASSCTNTAITSVTVNTCTPAAALNFDGGNDYVNCGVNTAFDLTTAITVESWINRGSINTYDCIIGKDVYGLNTGYSFWIFDNNKFVLRFGNRSYQSTSSVSAGAWNHLAGTYSSGTLKLYLNGVLDATFTVVANPVANSGGLYLGTPQDNVGNSTYGFDGSMDEVRIWNTARTQCEINTYKDCEIPTSSAGLIANYHFNQGFASASNSAVTTLTDASGNSFSGALTNFALTGSTSNWIAPGGVISGSVAPLAAPTVSSTVTNSVICNGSSTTLNGTGVSTYTWTGGVTNGVAFSPSVTTTYSLTGTSAAGCTATNIATQLVMVNTSPLVSVSTTSNSLCAGQSTTLNANPPTSYGLRFNGTNGYVSIPTTSNIPVGNSPYTMEAWINSTSIGASGIVGFGNWGNGGQANALRFGSPTQLINYWWGSDLTVNCPNAADGLWHHIAATFDGTTRKIYMDGVLLGSDLPGATSHSVTAVNMRVGSTNNGEYFNGKIDDVRIWNIARTQQELDQNKTNCMNGNEAGLTLLYNMNNGTGSSTVSDLTGNNNTGTLTNMNTATDWVTGNNNCNTSYVWNPTALTTPSVNVSPAATTVYSVTVTAANGCANTGTRSITVNPLPVISGSPTSSIICKGQSVTLNGVGANTYTWTGGITNGVAFSPSLTTTYSVTGTSASGCTGTNVVTSTVGVMSNTVNTSLQRPPGSGYAVNLDGTNDIVNISPSFLLTNVGLSSFALDAWIYPTSLSGVRSIIRKEGDFNLYLSGGVLAAEAYTGGGNFTLANAASAVTVNQWSHVAAVWNGSAFSLYINGTLISQNVGGGNSASTSNLNIGGSSVFGQYFVGMIDEVCIWRTGLTQAEVRDWMCKKIKTAHPQICKLAAYYRFDENSGATAFDYMNSHNGALTNGPLQTLSGAPLGDNAVWLANATVSSTLTLAHPSGDNMKATLTAGTASLMAVYSVDTVPNVTTPPGTFNQLSQVDYFGVKLFGSTGGVYSTLYDYNGHVGIVDESTLGLASRANNGATSWTEETTAVLNTTANTLFLGGQTGTEFILASKGSNPLPIELLNFSAVLNNTDLVDLEWATASEINNDYFIVQRSQDGTTWEDVYKKTASGTTTTRHDYGTRDEKPHEGISYYRLKQVDFNGSYTYSQIESVNLSPNDFVRVFPNPFSQYCTLEFKAANSIKQLEIYNSLGQMVVNIFVSPGQTKVQLDFSKFVEGVYYLKLDGLQIKQKLVNYNR